MPSAVIHADPLPHGIPNVVMRRVEQRGNDGHTNTHGLRIAVAPARPSTPYTPDDHATEQRWREMLAQNPRLYSGPLLAVVSIDFDEGVIHTRRDEFKRLAVQPQVKTGVQILSVTGVITARDAHGVEHVLLGRRGRTTRIYGGLWELGPSGGLTPPAAMTTTLDERDARRQVLEEAEEELGLQLGTHFGPGADENAGDLGAVGHPLRETHAKANDAAHGCVLYIRDAIACSDDIVIPLRHNDAGSLERLDAALKQQRATHAWEYEETRWVAIADVPKFDAEHASETIITTRAAFRGLGWVKN